MIARYFQYYDAGQIDGATRFMFSVWCMNTKTGEITVGQLNLVHEQEAAKARQTYVDLGYEHRHMNGDAFKQSRRLCTTH